MYPAAPMSYVFKNCHVARTAPEPESAPMLPRLEVILTVKMSWLCIKHVP